jgi:hypothetical protein
MYQDGIGPHILQKFRNQEPGLYLALQDRISLSDPSGIMPVPILLIALHFYWHYHQKCSTASLVPVLSSFILSIICGPNRQKGSSSHFMDSPNLLITIYSSLLLPVWLFRHTYWLSPNERTFKYTLDRV